MNQPSEVDTSLNPPIADRDIADHETADHETADRETELPTAKPQPSYVKLAMRNMVRKRGTSIYHFALTAIGLLTVLVGLAYLTR